MKLTMGPAFFYPQTGGSTPTGLPMDAFTTGMLSAYGLMQVLSAYSGPLIRVRRDTDNAEADIGFLSNGSLDVTSLGLFVGDATGYVTKWYDQRLYQDAVQTTQAFQPRIYYNGLFDGHVTFDGVDDYLIAHTPASVALSFAYRAGLPTPPVSGAASYLVQHLIGTSGANAVGHQYQANDGYISTYDFTDTSSFSHRRGTFGSSISSNVLVANRAAYPAQFFTNGAANTIDSDTTGTPTNAAHSDQDLYIGGDGASQPGAFQFDEFICWTVDQSSHYFAITAALSTLVPGSAPDIQDHTYNVAQSYDGLNYTLYADGSKPRT